MYHIYKYRIHTVFLPDGPTCIPFATLKTPTRIKKKGRQTCRTRLQRSLRPASNCGCPGGGARDRHNNRRHSAQNEVESAFSQGAKYSKKQKG